MYFLLLYLIWTVGLGLDLTMQGSKQHLILRLCVREMTGPYIQSGEPLNDFLLSFWQRQVDAAENDIPDYRHPPLPLARIKKVMKSDPDVKVSMRFP